MEAGHAAASILFSAKFTKLNPVSEGLSGQWQANCKTGSAGSRFKQHRALVPIFDNPPHRVQPQPSAFTHRLSRVEIPLTGDKAYGDRANTTTPIKKPKGKDLTQDQKDFNKGVSQQRVFVEHLIRVIKIFRIAKQLFRMRSGMYEPVIAVVCALVRHGGNMPKTQPAEAGDRGAC